MEAAAVPPAPVAVQTVAVADPAARRQVAAAAVVEEGTARAAAPAAEMVGTSVTPRSACHSSYK